MTRKPCSFSFLPPPLSLPATAAAPPFETPRADRLHGRPVLGRGALREGCRPADAARLDGEDDDHACRLRADRARRAQARRMCTVRPETWQRWHGPEAGSTMFLSPGEQVSVRNLLHGIVTLSGNDATVVLAECISGNEALRRADEPQVARAGPQQLALGQSGRLAGQRRHLHDRAGPRDARRRDDPRPSPALPRILWHARVHLGPDAGLQPADHPGQPQPAARARPGRRRPEDRPYRGGRLRLHRLGRAERPPHRDGRRRAGQLQPADRGIGAVHGLGLPRLAVAAAAHARASGSARRGSSSAAI